MTSQSASSPDENAVKYRNMMYAELNSCRKEKVLCDVTVVVGHKEFPAHKLILSTFSPIFKNMFCGNFLEASKSSVSLTNLEADIMDEILEFAYTGNIKITCDTAVRILEAAHFLQVELLCITCCQFLEENIDSENCLHLLELSHVYSCKTLKEKAEKYFLQVFSDIFVKDTFLELKLELLTGVLASDYLIVKSEAEVLEAVLRWVNFKEERKSLAPTVLRHVRLSQLDVQYLRGRIKEEETVWSSLECMQLLFEMQCDEQSGEACTSQRRGMMEIFVTTLRGRSTKYEVRGVDSIGYLKRKIEDTQRIPVSMQRLIFQCRQLLDDRTISFYNIEDQSAIYIVLKLGVPCSMPRPPS